MAKINPTKEFGINIPPERQNKMTAEITNQLADVTNTLATPEPNQASNPFDPASLRLDSSNDLELGAKKLISSVVVKKPSPQDFFRAHPSPDYRMIIAGIEIKDTREFYAVTPAMANEFPGEIKRVEIRTCITRAGVVFFWAVAVPTPDGRETAWHTSARFAAETSETRWVRMKSNMSAGRYDVIAAPAGLADPLWPEATFAELLQLAFSNGRLIDSPDHPVLRSLKGLL